MRPSGADDPVCIVGIIQAYKKAARIAQSFTSNQPAQRLVKSLVYSEFNVEEAYNNGKRRYGSPYTVALNGDISLIKELQTFKLALLELTETLRDHSEDEDRFLEPPFLALQKISDDTRNGILDTLEKLTQSLTLPHTLLAPQKRSSVPPTPPPKDDYYVSGGVSSQRDSKSSNEGREREPDHSRSIKFATQLAIPPSGTRVRSTSPKSNRRMVYISDPKSATSRSPSPRPDLRSTYSSTDTKSESELADGMPNYIAKEEVDQRIDINEAWLHQRQMSRIAFRASSITSEYSDASSPRASLASMIASGPPTSPPQFFEESFTAATSVYSEDFSRYSLGKLNPPNLIYDHTENKIIFLDRPEIQEPVETKPLFSRRGASEENFRVPTFSSSTREEDLEDDRSPRTNSLPIMGQLIEDDTQYNSSRRTTVMPAQIYEDGLMLVNEAEMESEIMPVITHKSTNDKSLKISPDASFYQYGGFCQGALMLQNSQPGAFKINKKPSGNYNATVSGKCVKCSYEVSWQAMEKDRLDDLSGIFSHPSGIRWRQRFLQKCHLNCKNLDETIYACIFCIEDGHTLEAYDATVFFTVPQLFRHLEKHVDIPRPEVKINVLSGTKGIDGYEFDIHFMDWGRRRPIEESDNVVKKLEGLACGTASANHRSRSSNFKTRDPDGAPSLQFAKGARILGITFPPRFSGAWASGYHDGLKAHFPSSFVLLDPPASADVAMSPKSSVEVIVRWDFKPPKEGGNWLPLQKREKIFNVGFGVDDEEGWCWSGKNSKGKWGFFPKVFVEAPFGSSLGLVESQTGSHKSSQSRSGVGGVFEKLSRVGGGHKYSSSMS